MIAAPLRCLALCALVALAATPVIAQPLPVPERCRVPEALLDDPARFPYAAAHVAKDSHLTIVAIGGASTQGMGASGPSASWPARLQMALMERLSGVTVSVTNLGKRGQTARMMLARFGNEIAPLKPDLVIWETGTVEAVRTHDPEELHASLLDGMDRVADMNASLILMDPQYARDTDLVINFQPYLLAIKQTADLADVNLFPRNDIMRYWSEEGRLLPGTREEMTRGNDAIYDCIAQLLARVIERGLLGAQVAK